MLEFLEVYAGCCGSSYGDRLGVLADFRHSAGSFHSPAVMQVCPPTGALPTDY